MIRCFSVAVGFSLVAGATFSNGMDVTFGLTTTQEASGFSRALVDGLNTDFPNYDFSYTVSGTSQLIRSLKDDLVPFGITHNVNKEVELVSYQDHKRTPVFANDFLFVGPQDSSIACEAIAECLKQLHASDEVFLSRGDQSGTNAYELAQWDKIKTDPMLMQNYQIASGGAANSLRLCSVRGCHLIIDESSFAARPNEDLVEIARDESANIYSLVFSVEFASQSGSSIIDWLHDNVPKISEEFGYSAQ